MSARYTVTDLVLRSKEDGTPLVAALESRWLFALDVRPSFRGMWHATFQTCREYKTPAVTIERLLRGIEALNPEARAYWDACSVREFSLGFVCSEEESPSDFVLSPDLLRRIVAAGGTLSLTIYPPSEPTPER